MPDSKQLTIERALDSQPIGRTEQRRMTQTDSLLSEVTENRRLYIYCVAWGQDSSVIG